MPPRPGAVITAPPSVRCPDPCVLGVAGASDAAVVTSLPGSFTLLTVAPAAVLPVADRRLSTACPAAAEAGAVAIATPPPAPAKPGPGQTLMAEDTAARRGEVS